MSGVGRGSLFRTAHPRLCFLVPRSSLLYSRSPRLGLSRFVRGLWLQLVLWPTPGCVLVPTRPEVGHLGVSAPHSVCMHPEELRAICADTILWALEGPVHECVPRSASYLRPGMTHGFTPHLGCRLSRGRQPRFQPPHMSLFATFFVSFVFGHRSRGLRGSFSSAHGRRSSLSG